MKLFGRQTLGVVLLGIGIVLLVVAFKHPRQAQSEVSTNSAIASDGSATPAKQSEAARGIAPMIVLDTQNDSPGTNFVTRIVTFSAEISGTPSPQLQWQIDKGNGFQDIVGATNSTYHIDNAQLEHNGFYALAATNAFGGLRTSPQQLIVTEGED